jgi:gamma-glutamyltranspeptidase/glutathione hydrolase
VMACHRAERTPDITHDAGNLRTVTAASFTPADPQPQTDRPSAAAPDGRLDTGSQRHPHLEAVLDAAGTAFDAAAARGIHCSMALEPHLNGAGGDLVGIFATAPKPVRTGRATMGRGRRNARPVFGHYSCRGRISFPARAGAQRRGPQRR